jgi:uncharacterized membrane protein
MLSEMNIDNSKILAAIIAVTLLVFPAAIFTTGTLRITLGLLFMVFFPGYTLLSALFPRSGDLGWAERVALSFGISIAVISCIGLILLVVPWGVLFYPSAISLALFIFITAAIAYYRQKNLPKDERISFSFKIRFSRWASLGKPDKALTIFLLLAAMAVLGCFGYAVAIPKQGEKFTEFYILGPQGTADEYPREAVTGEPVYLMMGIINREQQPISYRLEIRVSGNTVCQMTTACIDHNQKLEEVISFTPQISGEKQKVEFILYKNNEEQPYSKEPVHLYLDIH